MLTKFDAMIGASITVIILSVLLFSNSVYAPNGGRPITAIQTDDNQYILPNNNGVIHLHGYGLTKTVDPANNTVTIATTSLYSVGNVAKIIYDPVNNPFNYLDDQFENVSLYTDDITHFEQFDGAMRTVIINPTVNTMNGQFTINLFKNGIDTGKSITVTPFNYTEVNVDVNQTFNKGDNLLWHINSQDTAANSLHFNAQAIVVYNFTGQ